MSGHQALECAQAQILFAYRCIDKLMLLSRPSAGAGIAIDTCVAVLQAATPVLMIRRLLRHAPQGSALRFS